MTTWASRRRFLAGTSALAASSLAAVACGAGRCASGITEPAPLPASPVAQTILARSRRPRPADWAALGADLDGQLVRPGDAGYQAGKRLYDPRFDGLRPAGIAYCRGAGDVVTCLAFARRFGTLVAARSGGHSYAGWSSTTGLIVDVTPMNEVAASGATAAVGAGACLIDVYSGLYSQGRALPGGSCPTVGIAGLTLGGGVGVTGRAHGLTCDNLEQVEIVTAEGTVRQASARQDGDLFWACQGGGGGNFGIVTRFTFRTWPASDVCYFFLRWPWSQAALAVAGWQSWAPHAPSALWSNLHLAAAPYGLVPSIEVGGTYLGRVDGLSGQLDALYSAVGSYPSSLHLHQASYLDAMLVMAGCGRRSVAECRPPSQGPYGTVSRIPQYAKSDFFTRPLSSSGIATLLRGVEAMQSVPGAEGGAGGVALDALGGAINQVKPAATAFVHRNALFGAQYTTTWSSGADPAGIGGQHAWLRSFWRSMRPYASGQAYQNYIDPDLTAGGAWKRAYYGSNFARLAAVKARYDPARLFRFPQAVLPRAARGLRWGPVIVDIHGHYTTTPAGLGTYRDALQGQLAGGAVGEPPRLPVISDDEIRASIEGNQLRVQRERGIDLTIFSPRASWMGHHVTDQAAAVAWARASNDLVYRVTQLFPAAFAAACQLPQVPGGSLEPCVAELRRCVTELGLIGCNLNPDPAGGFWSSPPLTDEYWFPLYEAMTELDVPAMIHVSTSCNPAVHTLGAHYLNADTTAFMQLVSGRLFDRFPSLRFVIPHGGGAVPYHWGRFIGLTVREELPSISQNVLANVYFDTCVYHQPGIDLLTSVVPVDNILFASEMLGAVRGDNPRTGASWDDTKRYIDASRLTDDERRKVFELNARKVYPRLRA